MIFYKMEVPNQNIINHDDRIMSVSAVDPNALVPSSMRGLRDIGSQVLNLGDVL